jgi:hypothetical protein
VILDGALGNAEFQANLLIALALEQEWDDFLLTVAGRSL